MPITTMGYSTIGSGATGYDQYHADFVSSDEVRTQRVMFKTKEADITSATAIAQLAATEDAYEKMYQIQATAASALAEEETTYGEILSMDIDPITSTLDPGEAPEEFTAAVLVRSFGLIGEESTSTYVIADFYSGDTLLSAEVDALVADLAALAETKTSDLKDTFDSGRW